MPQDTADVARLQQELAQVRSELEQVKDHLSELRRRRDGLVQEAVKAGATWRAATDWAGMTRVGDP